MSDRHVPWVTYVLIAANVAMFGVELANGASAVSPKVADVLPLGGNFAPLTLRGEWWRLGASMFLHYGLLHIAMNMLCLYQGRGVEEIYGRLGFVAIYFAAGILGGVGSVARSANTVSAGASGAVFGVFGAFGAYLVVRRASIDRTAWEARARSLATFVALNLFIGFQTSGIDLTAHVVGLATGFAVGVALLAGAGADAHRTVRAVVALVVALGASVAILVALPKPFDLDALGRELVAVESRCVDTYNAALKRAQAGTLSEADFADIIERDVLPPWHAMREKIEAQLDDKRFHLTVLYVKDRDAAWQMYVRALRSPGDDAALERYKSLERTVDDDRAALDRESKRLTK
jgi:membrane associated rhomboid family serine protease